MANQKLILNFMMLFATMIWSSTFLVIKLSLGGVHAVTLVFYRFLLAAIIMGGFLLLMGKNPWQAWRSGLVLGLLLFVAYTTQSVALYYLSVVDAGFISGLFVIFVPILSLIFGKEQLRLSLVSALFLAAAGLWIITGGVKAWGLGDFLILVSTLFFALHIFYVDFVIKKSDLWVVNFQQFLVAAGFGLITVLLGQFSFVIINNETLWWILYLALFANVVGYLLQLRVQNTLTPTICALIISLEPVMAALFAWTAGREKVMVKDIIGGAVIVMAVIIAQLYRNNGVRSQEY